PDATRRTIEFGDSEVEVRRPQRQVESLNWNKPDVGGRSTSGPRLIPTSPLIDSSGAERVEAPEHLKTARDTLPVNECSGWTPDEVGVSAKDWRHGNKTPGMAAR